MTRTASPVSELTSQYGSFDTGIPGSLLSSALSTLRFSMLLFVPPDWNIQCLLIVRKIGLPA